MKRDCPIDETLTHNVPPAAQSLLDDPRTTNHSGEKEGVARVQRVMAADHVPQFLKLLRNRHNEIGTQTLCK